MPDHPTNPAWKQILPIALLVLGVGFYGQYTRTAGVFAADGLVPRAGKLIEQLLQPAAVSPVAEQPTELAIIADPAAPGITDSQLRRLGEGQTAPFRSNRAFIGGFGSCPSSHCR